MKLRHFPRIAFLFLLFAMPLKLWAGDLIESRAYFKDPTGELTLAEVQQKPFTPYTGILNEGFTDAVYWLRLRIDPRLVGDLPQSLLAGGFPPAIHVPPAESDKLVLRVRPPFLDQVELFDPLEPDRRNRITGNVTPWFDSEFRSLNHGFVLPMGNGARDVWLRIAATSTILVGVEALPYAEMLALEKRQELLNLLDLALILFFILWAMLVFAMRPDRLVGAFLVVMVVSFFYASNYMGYYRIFLGDILSAYWLDKAHSFLVMSMVAAYMLFSRRILADYKPKLWMMHALLALQYYFLLGGLLLLIGYETLALMVNIVVALIGQAWVCFTLIWGVKPSPQPGSDGPLLPRAWVLTYSLLLMFLFAGVALPALGLIDATQTSLYRSIIQGTVPFTMMAAIVYLRNRRFERQQQRQVFEAEQEAAVQKRRREDSEQFLAMLTHEIRTPLTVMAYAAKTDLPEGQLGEHVRSGIREIDELIERCLQADRADEPSLQLSMTVTTLETILHASRARFVGDRVRWHIESPPNTEITTDAAVFEVVLNNLIDNALKYSPTNTPVDVVVMIQREEERRTAQGLVVRVSNQPGTAGFPDASRLYEKYYRAPRAHIKTGSGLGLYVARSFAHKLGGHLDYHPTTDLVQFELWLPL